MVRLATRDVDDLNCIDWTPGSGGPLVKVVAIPFGVVKINESAASKFVPVIVTDCLAVRAVGDAGEIAVIDGAVDDAVDGVDGLAGAAGLLLPHATVSVAMAAHARVETPDLVAIFLFAEQLRP